MKVIFSISNSGYSNTCQVYVPRLTVIRDLSYWEGKKQEDCKVLSETGEAHAQWTECGRSTCRSVGRSQGLAVGVCLRGLMGAGVSPV